MIIITLFHDKSKLTKANRRYMLVGCSLRLNIKPIISPKESTKATISSSGLKKVMIKSSIFTFTQHVGRQFGIQKQMLVAQRKC